jgi:hypothetical protein
VERRFLRAASIVIDDLLCHAIIKKLPAFMT